MSELDPWDASRDDDNRVDGRDGQSGRPKKKDKVRSVWISFIAGMVSEPSRCCRSITSHAIRQMPTSPAA